MSLFFAGMAWGCDLSYDYVKINAGTPRVAERSASNTVYSAHKLRLFTHDLRPEQHVLFIPRDICCCVKSACQGSTVE